MAGSKNKKGNKGKKATQTSSTLLNSLPEHLEEAPMPSVEGPAELLPPLSLQHENLVKSLREELRRERLLTTTLRSEKEVLLSEKEELKSKYGRLVKRSQREQDVKGQTTPADKEIASLKVHRYTAEDHEKFVKLAYQKAENRLVSQAEIEVVELWKKLAFSEKKCEVLEKVSKAQLASQAKAHHEKIAALEECHAAEVNSLSPEEVRKIRQLKETLTVANKSLNESLVGLKSITEIPLKEARSRIEELEDQVKKREELLERCCTVLLEQHEDLENLRRRMELIQPLLESFANVRNRNLIHCSCNKAGTPLSPEQKLACEWGNYEAHGPSGDLDAACFREELFFGTRLESYFFDLYETTVDEWENLTPRQKKVRNSRACLNGARSQEPSEARAAVEIPLVHLEAMGANELKSPEATAFFLALSVPLKTFFQKEKTWTRRR